MRIAIVGTGGIATKAWLPLLASRPGIELAACNRSPGPLAAAVEGHRPAFATTDLDTLVAWKPAAAFVLTATGAHAAIVEKLLRAGIDVCVEKPATPTSAATRALAELAERERRVLMVAFNRRYAPLHARARELWAGRTIGLAVFEKHRGGAAHPDLLSNYVDDTIHLIDLVRFFCGEGEAVDTVARTRDGRLVDAASTVRLASGGHAHLLTSLEAGTWRERVALHGAGASLELDAFSGLRFAEGAEERTWTEGYARSWTPTLEARGFAAQIDHFLDCVATRRAPSTSAWDSVKTQTLLEELVARAR